MMNEISSQIEIEVLYQLSPSFCTNACVSFPELFNMPLFVFDYSVSQQEYVQFVFFRELQISMNHFPNQGLIRQENYLWYCVTHFVNILFDTICCTIHACFLLTAFCEWVNHEQFFEGANIILKVHFQQLNCVTYSDRLFHSIEFLLSVFFNFFFGFTLLCCLLYFLLHLDFRLFNRLYIGTYRHCNAQFN